MYKAMSPSRPPKRTEDPNLALYQLPGIRFQKYKLDLQPKPIRACLVLLYSNFQAMHPYLTISPRSTMLQQRELVD